MQFFAYIEEIEYAIEVLKKTGLPVVASMCIGILGDENDVSTEECLDMIASLPDSRLEAQKALVEKNKKRRETEKYSKGI